MAWSCVEDRTADGQFGRVLRKIVFDDIYADRTALLSRHPIPLHSLAQLKAGDRIAFYDNTSIREGNFLCSSQSHKLSAKDILTHILQTEEELKQFCEANSINTKNQHIFALVIEAFLLLTKKIECQHAFYPNGFVDHTARKRPAEWNVNDYLPSRKQQQMNQQMAAAAAAASNGGLHPSVLNEINRSLMAQALRNSQLQFAQAAAQQQASQHDEQLATVTELTEKNDSTTTPTTPPITNCTNTTPPKTEPNQSDMLDMTPPTEQTEPRKTVIEENNATSPKSASAAEITELKGT